MTEGVLVAIVTVLGGVLIALIERTRRHARAARTQVENSHATNFRDESDERHRETIRRLDDIAADVRGLRRDIGRHADQLATHERRIDELELIRSHFATPSVRRQR
jgi:hypothetical protein